jgi:nitrate reductase gamma subunit
MTAIASSLINWSALWKICLAALIGGAGVVIVFGFLLLAVDRATSSKSEGVRITSYAMAGVCALFVVGAAVAGIYAMAHKPRSKPAKPTKSAQVAPSARAPS